MRPLSAPLALEVWERGEREDATGRSLALLAAALPGRPPGALARLSLGQRDAALFELRRSTFGSELPGSARCPRCGAALEFALDAESLSAAHPAAPAGDRPDTLEHDGWRLRYRLPDSADLAAAGRAGSVEAARALLLERCVIGATRDGAPAAAGELPEEVVEALGAALEEADPLAELPIEIDCAGCSHRWTVLLDIGAFLWAEVSAVADRLLHEVGALAQAYGWSEAEILAMSAVRRRRYLEMMTSG